ncbi:diaminobutyrate acetyltransferase [Mariniphaga sediminis]|jgi:L-2,4-diaminobutyric acid acetyltransferase|uniref:L-2,4-diaminobutyric acid acetyltransferase n=1 Tax=Mariniphaga sediminis TaxID=1628158 RepID=A0A399D2Y4_9BACT|nr:diaminobutyrate acetyltransferase [Mariniphaga sediminis]RIH66244.1 diaminobutyrate acetyltransferase [Mariniphaga sediminis]
MLQDESSYEKTSFQFKRPTAEDGYAVNQLIEASPPLDPNSVYCNILQSSHFAETSVCAKTGENLSGFISGYLIPTRPDTLFIWQVAVAEPARGNGLAIRMLHELLDRPACKDVRFVETTITPSNTASKKLFQKLANNLKTKIEVSDAFTKEKHFNGLHDTEQLYRIGPII